MPFPFCCFSSPSSSSSTRSSYHLKHSTLQAAANNLTKIFEELKCPVCFNICVPPIHNCVNGHIICNTCRLKGHFTSCPTCRQSLTSGGRNMFAENFVLNYSQQCCYACQGCEHLRVKGCSMKSHELKCMFRPVKCIVGSCRQHIPYTNYLAHLECGHKALGTDALPTQVQFKWNPKKKGGGGGRRGNKWLPFYMQAFGNVYYLKVQRVRKELWVWVYSQLGKETDELENTYTAYIKLKHPTKKISVSWCGPIYSIRTPFRSIQEEGCAFTLPLPLVRNFCLEGSLNFSVDIKKVARRSLKGMQLLGESDTVVSGGLPQEYNRPPSFYEPPLLSSSQPPPPVLSAEYQAVHRVPSSSLPSQQGHQGASFEVNGRSFHRLCQYSSLSVAFPPMKDVQETMPPTPPFPPKRRTRETIAIGRIPSSMHAPPSQTSTPSSFRQNTAPPADLFNNLIPNTNNNNNEEVGDGDDEGFGDATNLK